jgi:methyl-accepting chemotaxis protein
MADEKPQRRLLRLLRRRPKAATREVEDQNALWAAHERAQHGARDASLASSRLATLTAKQRGAMELIADRSGTVNSRSDECAHDVLRMREVYDRLNVVALNVSLEATRQPEAVAKPLTLVADEVRSLANRGGELARELETELVELKRDLHDVGEAARTAKDATQDVATEASRVGAATSTAERALGELRDHLRRTTGTDPETMKALADAAEHTRALVTALGTLSGKVPQNIVASALRPAVEPLLRLLSIDDDDDDS